LPRRHAVERRRLWHESILLAGDDFAQIVESAVHVTVVGTRVCTTSVESGTRERHRRQLDGVVARAITSSGTVLAILCCSERFYGD
jgi:hypothetical protein